MDPELKQVEEELERLTPQRLPDGLIARMEAAMQNWEQGEDKVVPFPARDRSPGRRRADFLKAAAAVAILGAALAFLWPNGTPQGPVATAERDTGGGAILAGVSPAAFSPQDAERKLVHAADHGVVVTHDSRPHRVVRVEAMDRYRFQNAKGEVLFMERPRVEYVLIPLDTD